MEVAEDGPLVRLFQAAANAPSGVALLDALGEIFLPALAWLAPNYGWRWAAASVSLVAIVIVFPIVSFLLLQNALLTTIFAGLTIPEWLTVAMTAFALFGIVQRLSRAARLKETL